MALSSKRQDSIVDPEKGVYVEMEGIMEVRYVSDDVDYECEQEDFYQFQRRVREIPDDFCHKNKMTSEQAIFFCLVCNCDLKSLRPLRDHVTGNKHIRKACEKKRQLLGLPTEPQNAPRIKKIRKEKPLVDVGKSLQERLEDCGEPAIGLGFITEFLNPLNPRDPPMYNCRLEGCKSAWGTSDDIFNHVIKFKHQKNFFIKQNPDDPRIAGLSGADILGKAAEFEEQLGGCEARNYLAIGRVEDVTRYLELRDRPDDWSEKKASLGTVGDTLNPNTIPLGPRKTGASLGADNTCASSSTSPPLFDPEGWKDWRPVGREEVLKQFNKHARRGVMDIEEMVGDFKGEKGSEEYEDINFYAGIYRDLLGVMEGDTEEAPGLLVDLERASQELENKVEKEDREMKNVSRLMAELEDEVKSYHSNRDSKKYVNIKKRLGEVTKENNGLQPTREANVKLKEKYNKRLTELWTQFESRSDSLAEILEQQVGGLSKSNRRLEKRQMMVESFRQQVLNFVVEFMVPQLGAKFSDMVELELFANKAVIKVVDQEVNLFVKKGSPWSMFRVTDHTKQCVENYLLQKIDNHVKGSLLSK